MVTGATRYPRAGEERLERPADLERCVRCGERDAGRTAASGRPARAARRVTRSPAPPAFDLLQRAVCADRRARRCDCRAPCRTAIHASSRVAPWLRTCRSPPACASLTKPIAGTRCAGQGVEQRVGDPSAAWPRSAGRTETTGRSSIDDRQLARRAARRPVLVPAGSVDRPADDVADSASRRAAIQPATTDADGVECPLEAPDPADVAGC